MLIVLLIALALVGMNAGTSRVAARSTVAQSTVVLQITTVPMLSGTTQVVNNGPRHQTNPHVGCGLAAYNNVDDQGLLQIRYFDFATNTDHLIPGNGTDGLSDVSSGRIAFTEWTPSGHQVVIFDTATQTRTVVPGLGHIRPAVGGNLVAFDSADAFTNLSESEIGIYGLSTGTVTWLTDDALYDQSAAVSPKGNAIVWAKCQTDGSGCHIYAAVQTAPGVFTTTALTGAASEDLFPDTNGQIAVYRSTRDGESDVYFQPVAGGAETRISIPGHQTNPNISGNLIAFESEVVVGQTAEYDIFVYDTSSGNLYRVTDTPAIEMMSDISVCNGIGRIVYAVEGADFDVYSFTFLVPGSAADQINDLIELVGSFNLPDGIENSLITKLQDALAAIGSSDTSTACDSLKAFIKATRAQSGKKLTTNQADQLINAANQIKTDLRCH